MKAARTLLGFVLLISTASCLSIAKVQKGRVNIEGAYSVQNDTDWASISFGKTHLWTVDGIGLQELRFITALEDGDAMFATRDPEKAVKFRDTMSELEVVEFFQASLAALGVQSFRTDNLRPFRFGDKAGFRFDFDYLTKDGLAMKGFSAGALVNKKLYLIYYVGTRLHYHDKHEAGAQRVMDSVQFL